MVKKGLKSGCLRAGGFENQVILVKCKKDNYSRPNKYYTEKGKRMKKKIKNKVEEVLERGKSFLLERCSNKAKKLKRKKSFQSISSLSSVSSKDKDDIFITEAEDKLLLSREVENKADDEPVKSKTRNRRKQRKQQKQQLEAQEEEDLDNILPVKEGDIVNVNKLLFTKHRNFLLKSNSKKLVRAEDLQGKIIVLFFANMSHDLWVLESFSLIEVYNQIHLKFPFEVVLVPFTRPHDHIRHPRVDPHRSFTSIFSSLPWTAIPYSDVTSCQRLLTTFGFTAHVYPNTPVIDPTGLVLDLYANSLFRSFGACGYPFTRQRINLLVSEDEAIIKYPSIWNLLASPERDYVISNNGDKVHIQSLEDKVVALHFFEEGRSPSYPELTAKLMTAYEQLAKTKNFEVVLIYVYDTDSTLGCTNEDKFWKRFKTMPWLALPFKDPVIKKIERICHYPLDLEGPAPDPRLVIVGPRGEYFEPYGADIFMNFGIPAYPFTRRKMVDLVAGKAKSVKLDMLWDSNNVLRRRDESEVKFSEVSGKRIILLIGINWVQVSVESLSVLKSKYNLMKGTDDEFEVIQIFDLRELSHYKEHAADLPWLVHPFKKGSHQLSLLLGASGDARLLAFDCHGQVVRRATGPCFEVGEDAKFPFFAAGDLEREVYTELYECFRWNCWQEDSIFHNMGMASA